MNDMKAKGRRKGMLTGDTHWSHNNPDALARGERHGSRTKPEKIRRGVLNGRAKLTESDVMDIRRRYANEPRGITNKLVAEYGVTRGTVLLLVKRKIWKHVK